MTKMVSISTLITLCCTPLWGVVQPADAAVIAPKIAAGNSHTMALMTDGTVMTWGFNASGQLGNGSYSSKSTPVTVTGLGGTVKAIAAGSVHSVALMEDGTLKNWGDNYFGELGNGTYNNNSTTPVTTTGLGNAVTAGHEHTVAIMTDGKVKAWGNNSYYQIGDGTNVMRTTPITVTGLEGTVMAIAAGRYHTLALLADGTVKAWGDNSCGQLGIGNSLFNSTRVTVTGLGGAATAIAAGQDHSAALMADGTVKVWGCNQSGQLGNGTTTGSSTPLTVTGLGGTATAVATGWKHTVTLMADGTVKSWGANIVGQLGDGTTSGSSTPVTVTGLDGTALAIAGGANHTVALMMDGTVKTWGANGSGQLGDGTTTDSITPVTALINLDNVPPIVTIDNPGGNYAESVSVALSCSDDFSGCSGIHYTVDGAIPTTSSTLISGPLSISSGSTLRYFAVDLAGNSSAVVSQTYTFLPASYSLTIIYYGSGGGTVALSSGGYCSGNCSQSIATDSVVTLTPTANGSSVFSGWNGCPALTVNQCSVTMSAAKSISAFFNLQAGGDVMVNGSTTSTISGGLGNVPAGGELGLKAGDFYEALTFNRPITLVLRGGYDSGFTVAAGTSTIHGSITIAEGTVIFDNIAIM